MWPHDLKRRLGAGNEYVWSSRYNIDGYTANWSELHLGTK